MQKKIIALAVAALASGAAMAQSNVTIYGIADVGQAFVKSSTGANGVAGQPTVGRLDSNSSYIGFKGVEDLGNGLKAVFQYESGFSADTAGAMAGGRDTYVGLTGGFGTVVAGTLTHPLRAMGAKVELTPGAAGLGTVSSITGTIAGVQTGADNRATNAIAYVSPNFSGFTATVAYVNGEVQNNGNNQAEARSYQFAGQYENGPLWLAAGYHAAQNSSAAGTLGNSEADARVYRLAGVYTFASNTKVTALWDNTKAETNAAGAFLKRNAYSLGVAQAFGNNTLGLEFARGSNVKTNAGDMANSRSSIITGVYSYALSKRTTVHARYSKLTNKDGIATPFYLNPVANSVALSNGSDSTGYMLGLRHAF